MISDKYGMANFDIKKYTIKEKPIGFGQYGIVKIAINNDTKEQYALKIIFIDDNDDDNKKYQMIDREITIMMYSENHAIIKCLGYSINENKVYILMKLMPNGSLQSIIEGKGPKINNTNRQIFLVGISYAMKYLHTWCIIHRDLKPSNILIDENLHPYLADFGLSKMYDVSNSNFQSSFLGTLIYMAPEILKFLLNDDSDDVEFENLDLNNLSYNNKVDVYAFGILMYQIVTNCKNPYPKKRNDIEFIRNVKNPKKQYRPEFKSSIKKPIKKLIENCWSHDPNERPSFDDVYEKLSSDKNYYLDGVDEEKLNEYTSYITNINPMQEHLNITLGKLLHIKEQKKILEKENEKLKKKNEKLFNQTQKLETENDRLKIIESANNITIKSTTIMMFNCYPLISQKAIISQLIKANSKNKFFSKIHNLLSCLNEIDEISSLKCIEICDIDEEMFLNMINDEKKIKLLPDATDILYKKKQFHSTQFIKILSNFDKLSIEIQSNSKKLDKIYSICNNIKSENENIEVSVFITGMEKTFNKFKNDKNIDGIRLDKCIKKITKDSFSGCTNLKDVIIPSSVQYIESYSFSKCTSLTKIDLPNSIICIEPFAFISCSNLKQISIPPSVFSIGNCIFKECTSLTRVNILANIKRIESNCFDGCTKMKQFDIPPSVKYIGSNAFNNCSSLRSIIIPTLVKKIENSSFKNCSSLKNISFLSTSLKEIGDNVFNGCSITKIKIPSSVTVIGTFAFSKSFLEEITIPSAVRIIGKNAFDHCVKLKKVTFEDNLYLKIIEEYTFNECKALEKITIPSAVNKIGKNAFDHCEKLKHVLFADNSFLISIEEYAFNECKSLETITIPSTVRKIGKNVFDHCEKLTQISFKNKPSLKLIEEYTFNECKSLEKITIPSAVSKIEKNAFDHCEKLRKVSLADNSSLVSIEKYAFNECKALENISIKKTNITEIKPYTFNCCEELTSVEMPNKLTKIGSHAFNKCSKLNNIKFPSTTNIIEKFAFYECKAIERLNLPFLNIKIGQNAFDKCTSLNAVILHHISIISINTFSNCTNLSEIVIPYSVKTISNRAFEGSSLVNVEIPSSVKTIGEYVFKDCSKLKSAKIKCYELELISNGLFFNCTNLIDVEIPSSIEIIGFYAFAGCTKLFDIIIPFKTKAISPYAFAQCTSLKYVYMMKNNICYFSPYAFEGARYEIVEIRSFKELNKKKTRNKKKFMVGLNETNS